MAAKFNKGDVSEGILAAAITARFLSKTKVISNSDVIKLITKLNKAPKGGTKGATSLTEFRSPNEQPKIFDSVVCKVNLAEVNMKAFLSRKIYQDNEVKGIVTAAVKFANGKYVMEWADMMYENNQENIIEVLSEGLLDQTGTKVDLKVHIDGIQAGVGISLKYGDVKQFGQVGGSKIESMVELFSPLGVTFNSSLKNKYIKLLSKKKISPALTLAYNEAVNQISRKRQKTLIKNISNFMDYHATRGEADVVLVQLNKSEAKIYDFGLLETKLIGHKVAVELTSGMTTKLSGGGYTGGNKIPKIEFTLDGTGDVLFMVRLKLEGNRVSSKGKRLPLTVRNYIEKGSATTQLIAE
jgi:hypothetical protein